MSDIEQKPSHVQTSDKPAKRGFKGHIKKFWWVYAIIGAILAVILLPILFLVAIPKIAQSKLNDAELEITSILMTRSEPTKFQMSVDSIIRSDGKVHAKIQPFTGVMYVTDGDQTPFAKLNFPETSSDAYQEVNITQETKIEDLKAFTDFNTRLLGSKGFDVTVTGDTGLFVKGISRRYPVTFTKTITLDGLENFAGLEVFNTTLSLSHDKAGNNFWGWVRIPNRSVVAFDVGNATFDTYLLDKKVGSTYLDNLFLQPGNDNVFPMRATVDQGAVLGIMGQKPYCTTAKGVVPFVLVGSNVTNNGQYLNYFADALAAGKQEVNIDLSKPFAKLGITVPCETTKA